MSVRAIRVLAASSVALLAFVGSAAGADIAGRASALDSDKVIIGQQRVILWGIDGPELDQDRGGCMTRNAVFGCGTNSHRQLLILAEEGPFDCKDTGKADPFNRPYMVCTVNGKDVAEQMVRAGWALAVREQTDQYVAAEAAAKAAKVGLWQDGVTFLPPWEWRDRLGR